MGAGMKEDKQKHLENNDILSADSAPLESKNRYKPFEFIVYVFKNTSKWILRVIQGAIIGAGAILPGISGGVLCVVFGIYQPMMALLAHPFKTFKLYARLLLPVLIGWAIGFMGLAGAVSWLLLKFDNMAVCLFIGLIAGMVPSLYRDAGKHGRPKSAWVALIVTTILIFALLIMMQSKTYFSIQPNIWWYFVCGILWGISLVAPGMSSSSILMYMGLYEPMSAGIYKGDFSVIVPMIIGIVLIIFISARAINYLFKKHYSVAFNIILGFVIASTLAIIPWPWNYKLMDNMFNLLCFAIGFVIAWLMDKLAQRMHYKEE
jgi:putative membrane protein